MRAPGNKLTSKAAAASGGCVMVTMPIVVVVFNPILLCAWFIIVACIVPCTRADIVNTAVILRASTSPTATVAVIVKVVALVALNAASRNLA